MLKSTKLYILKEWIVGYVNYISTKLSFKKLHSQDYIQKNKYENKINQQLHNL